MQAATRHLCWVFCFSYKISRTSIVCVVQWEGGVARVDLVERLVALEGPFGQFWLGREWRTRSRFRQKRCFSVCLSLSWISMLHLFRFNISFYCFILCWWSPVLWNRSAIIYILYWSSFQPYFQRPLSPAVCSLCSHNIEYHCYHMYFFYQ